MAVYKIFPQKDSTIYSIYPEKNVGKDAILELYNNIINNPQTSRILVQFDENLIKDIIDNKIQNKDWESYLKLHIANSEELIENIGIEVNLCAKDWEEGINIYEEYSTKDKGVSWIYRNNNLSPKWINDLDPFENEYGKYTGSYLDEEGGGVWYTQTTGSLEYGWGLSSSMKFDSKQNLDINLNISDLIYHIVGSGSVESLILNNGFIIKLNTEIEFNENYNIQPILRYFSSDTNTIYPPHLELKWEDFTWNTGSSIEILNTDKFHISLSNNKGKYYNYEINKFRVYSRLKYPPRLYQTSSIYNMNYYLPEESFYAVKDMYTNEYVIDFDEKYTKISVDEESSFFNIYMDGLQPERYYKILIKSKIGNNIHIIDNNNFFKITNG